MWDREQIFDETDDAALFFKLKTDSYNLYAVCIYYDDTFRVLRVKDTYREVGGKWYVWEVKYLFTNDMLLIQFIQYFSDRIDGPVSLIFPKHTRFPIDALSLEC